MFVGISGASGSSMASGCGSSCALEIQTHPVMSPAAEVTLAHETDLKVTVARALADHCHAQGNIAAAISSGSFRTMGMIVVPCSIHSLSEIATEVTAGLISGAARARHLSTRVCKAAIGPAPRPGWPGR